MMTSDIIILAFTIRRRFHDELPFHYNLIETVPVCLIDHLPKDVDLVSIDYQKDAVIDAVLFSLTFKAIDIPVKDLHHDFDVESGYFNIKLEGCEDSSRNKSEAIEFVFSRLCESNPHVSALMYSMVDGEFIQFARTHLFDGVNNDSEDISHFTPLLDEYFNSRGIPDQYADEIAKQMLLGSE